MNDLIDYKNDIAHPEKSKRPIASGQLSKKFALVLSLILLILSLYLGFRLNIICFCLILSYFILNVFYSIYFKKIELIDVFCIALGFILRIVAGCFAIAVIPSPLVILLTFFVSMFFTFSKRKLEFELMKEECRKSIQKFNLKTLDYLVLINAVLSISFYITYMLDENTIQKTNSEYLYITTIPFVLIIFRLFYLVNTQTQNDDPIYFIEKDKGLKWLFLIYLITLFIILAL